MQCISCWVADATVYILINVIQDLHLEHWKYLFRIHKILKTFNNFLVFQKWDNFLYFVALVGEWVDAVMQSPCYAVIVMQSPWGGACPACWLSKKRLSRLKVHTIVVVIIIVMAMIIIIMIKIIISIILAIEGFPP